MNIDQENKAGEVVSVAKARRPKWLRIAARKTPSWFSGGELDVLEKSERDTLYREIAPKFQTSTLILVVVLASNGFNIIRGLHVERERGAWIIVISAYVVVALGVWLYKRWAILRAARRSVRESADWPLRREGRAA